ncbi:DUF2284 domain-containing protein [Lachnospiraceae bacterium KK002]
MNFTHYAATKSATIPYTVELCLRTPAQCAEYEDKTTFDALCKNGCPNYARKWSCPPFAPSFADFTGHWKNLYVIFMHTELAEFSYIKNSYLKVKAANSVLKSRADRFTRRMAELHGSYISTGSCRLCKSCKCKGGAPCAHPASMSYSFEALGIDVNQMVTDCFQKPLLWYRKSCAPRYTSVVCGILTNEELSLEYLRDACQMYVIS